MRRLRIMMLCIVGACGCGVLAASSASAALPELGRCVPVAGTGSFVGAGCIGLDKDGKDGGFEWAPGPGAKKGINTNFPSVTLENTKAHKISCTNGSLTGEYTGAKSLKIVKVRLLGCEDETHHTACYTNPTNPAVIESETALAGELGAVIGSKNETNPFAGWDLKAENSSMPILAFFCGEAKGLITFTLEGSAIGRVTKTNAMFSSFSLAYKQTAGIQALKSFIGGAEDVLKLGELPFGQKEVETNQAGLAGTGTITDEEALEIKAKI